MYSGTDEQQTSVNYVKIEQASSNVCHPKCLSFCGEIFQKDGCNAINKVARRGIKEREKKKKTERRKNEIYKWPSTYVTHGNTQYQHTRSNQ